MNNSTNTHHAQESQAIKFLNFRLDQDAVRDPVDALTDAESLLQILQCIHTVLHDPTTRYILAHRVREDLARGDLAIALSEAQQLVAIQRNRWEDMKGIEP